MRYSLDNNGNVVAFGNYPFEYELTDEPFSMVDYHQYKKDLTTGEWIYNPIIMVPKSISKLQAVSRLLEIDRYNDLMTALGSDPTGKKRILFDAAHQLDRDSSMVNEMGVALGFTSEDLDTLFVEASKILV